MVCLYQTYFCLPTEKFLCIVHFPLKFVQFPPPSGVFVPDVLKYATPVASSTTVYDTQSEVRGGC